MGNKKLSIITVTMNHLSQVKELLFSLYKECIPEVDFEMIIVDNCSNDGTVDFIAKEYPQVKLIRNRKVYGFAKNNNIGYKCAKGEYIGIVNPDIIILPNSIDQLVSFLDNHQNVGICCPMLLYPDHSLQYSVRKFITPISLFYRALSLGKDDVDNRKNSYLIKEIDSSLEYMNIDWAIGAAYFVRRNVFERIGGFDEKFFLYVEDVDLCLSVKKKGYDVVYLPNVKMIHAHNRKSTKSINRYTFIHLKSFLYYFWKHNLWFRSTVKINR
jgi:N-acetylglucosaminyl-diphospho-decaprenol L-rhamnosyltransferase